MNLKLPLAAAFVLLLPACDKPPEPTNPPDGADSGAPPATGDGGAAADGGAVEPGAPGVAWAEKTDQQRMEYMGIVVLPAMKTAFKEFNENDFKDFKCQTCHGDDMNEVKYKMPTDSIYPLDPKDPIKSGNDQDEKITKFMMEKIVPDVAKMLDMEPVKEFGCMSCHPSP